MTTKAGLSERDDLCESCGDPLLVCPSTASRLVRCCDGCTHRTKLDVAREGWKRDFNRWRSEYIKSPRYKWAKKRDLDGRD